MVERTVIIHPHKMCKNKKAKDVNELMYSNIDTKGLRECGDNSQSKQLCMLIAD